ncbi:MAG: hypothetical protein U0835_00220 [Isosphaeraceae bacterium]
MVGHSGNYYNAAYVPLLPPLARPASANSASVDLQNYDSAAFLLNVGAAGDTWSGTNRVEASLQESDDNSTWTAVADADMLSVVSGGQATGTFKVFNANAQAGQLYVTGYRGNKRYVRVALTNFGTTSTGTPMDVIAVLGRPRFAPVNS